jgi:hypothetical protein
MLEHFGYNFGGRDETYFTTSGEILAIDICNNGKMNGNYYAKQGLTDETTIEALIAEQRVLHKEVMYAVEKAVRERLIEQRIGNQDDAHNFDQPHSFEKDGPFASCKEELDLRKQMGAFDIEKASRLAEISSSAFIKSKQDTIRMIEQQAKSEMDAAKLKLNADIQNDKQRAAAQTQIEKQRIAEDKQRAEERFQVEQDLEDQKLERETLRKRKMMQSELDDSRFYELRKIADGSDIERARLAAAEEQQRETDAKEQAMRDAAAAAKMEQERRGAEAEKKQRHEERVAKKRARDEKAHAISEAIEELSRATHKPIVDAAKSRLDKLLTEDYPSKCARTRFINDVRRKAAM